MGDPTAWAAIIAGGIISLVAAFGGAMVGVRYEEQLGQRRREREKLEHVAAVSEQLRDEIDHNLALVQAFRDRIEHAREGSSDEQSFIVRALFIKEQMPFWRNVVYRGQAPQFVDVFHPDVASAVHTLYNRLDRLKTLQERIEVKARPHLAEDYFEWKPRSRVAGEAQFEGVSLYKDCIDFNAKTSEDWSDAWNIINQISSTENPVPVPTKSISDESRTSRALKMVPWSRPRG